MQLAASQSRLQILSNLLIVLVVAAAADNLVNLVDEENCLVGLIGNKVNNSFGLLFEVTEKRRA